jgi:hypothetical protein
MPRVFRPAWREDAIDAYRDCVLTPAVPLSPNTQDVLSASLSVNDWAFTLGGRLQVNF